MARFPFVSLLLLTMTHIGALAQEQDRPVLHAGQAQILACK